MRVTVMLQKQCLQCRPTAERINCFSYKIKLFYAEMVYTGYFCLYKSPVYTNILKREHYICARKFTLRFFLHKNNVHLKSVNHFLCEICSYTKSNGHLTVHPRKIMDSFTIG